MYRTLFFIVLLVFFGAGLNLSAQGIDGGTIKYQLITKLDFSKRLEKNPDNQRLKDWLADLPEESVILKTLTFTTTESLYEEIITENEAVDPKVRRAAFFMSFGRKPRPTVEKVYLNIDKNKKVEQLSFMTRKFIVESDVEAKNWKLSTEMRKIKDYPCMSAEMIIEVDSMKIDTIVAWFTPQIPLSLGPENYTGLPGLVLAVEKNSETILLASSIELTAPAKDAIVKPSEGKKVTKKELDKIIEEKIKEFEETRRQGGGHGPGGHRH